MNAQTIVEELRGLGSDSYKKVMFNHGVQEPFFGVKVEELKKIQKRIKRDYQLALDLFETGIYDAMYLAGLIADDLKMTKDDLQRWMEKANCSAVAGITVAWVAAESRHGWEMARKWIDSADEKVAAAGWSTLGSLVGIKDDAELDIPELKRLIERVETTIHAERNRVRYSMNGFLIAVGSYVAPLTEAAKAASARIGTVTVDMGNTACKVPSAVEYIQKVEQRGALGRKRKTAKC